MSENISNEIFKQKYLKYKSKYINLKNELKGGLSEDLKKYNTSLMKIFLNQIEGFTVHSGTNFTIFFKNEGEINFDFNIGGSSYGYEKESVSIRKKDDPITENYIIDIKEIKVNKKIRDLLDYTIFLFKLTNEDNKMNQDQFYNLVEKLDSIDKED